MPARFDLAPWEIAASAVVGIAASVAGLWVLPPAAAVIGGYMLFSVLLIVVVDRRQFLIPDILSLPAIPLGLALSLMDHDPVASLTSRAAAAAAAALALYSLARLYRKARGFDGLGLGDVKLAAAAGAWTGFTGLPLVLLVASVAALSAVLLRSLLVRSDRATLTTAVPFGSFLAPAILAVWVFQQAGFY